MSSDAISERARPLRKGPLSYIDVFISALPDLWSPENTRGWIAAVVAENKLSGNELFLERMLQAPRPDLSVMNYGNMKGIPQCQKAICDLMNRTFIPDVHLKPDNLCIMSGCTSVIDSLVFCLCNPGEGVLIPQPSYAAFDNDLKARAHVNPVEFPFDESQGNIEEQLLSVVSQSQVNGTKIRGMIVTNPNNPLGTIYEESTIRSMMIWCIQNKIHYISDEIYALSIHEPSTTFTSSLCLLRGIISDAIVTETDALTYVHHLYGLSKDWCASGLRVGCLYSENHYLQEALNSLAPMGGVSNYQQYILADVLSDVQWTRDFIARNSKELHLSYETLTKGLDGLGIEYVPAKAGIFVWVDMRKFLPENSWEGEKQLWDKICTSCKVIFTPGESCHATKPGYFRICFAWISRDALQMMLERLQNVF